MSRFPKTHTVILCMAKVSESSVICFIMPFVNQMVASFDPTGASSARYCGLIESALIITESISSPLWGLLADSRGRKPLLVIGLAAFSVACLAIGLSKTLLEAVLARCISGVFGAVSVLVRTIQFEITDNNHIDQVLEWLAPCWAIGATLGPMVGGALAEPAKSMPTIFKDTIFDHYPYLLPSLVAAILPALAAIAAFFFMPETLGRPIAEPSANEPTPIIDEEAMPFFSPSASTLIAAEEDKDGKEVQKVTYGQLLGDWRIIYTMICSAALSFVSMAYNAGFMMMASTSVANGGLGLEPWQMGCLLAFSSVMGIAVATIVVPIFTRKFGWYRGIKFCAFAHIILFPLVGMAGHFARLEGGVGYCCGGTIVFIVLAYEIGELGFTGIDVAIADRCPKGCLGSINGLSSSCASFGRMIAPIMAGQLWAICVEGNSRVETYAIWFIFTLAAMGWFALTLQLDTPAILAQKQLVEPTFDSYQHHPRSVEEGLGLVRADKPGRVRSKGQVKGYGSMEYHSIGESSVSSSLFTLHEEDEPEEGVHIGR